MYIFSFVILFFLINFQIQLVVYNYFWDFSGLVYIKYGMLVNFCLIYLFIIVFLFISIQKLNFIVIKIIIYYKIFCKFLQYFVGIVYGRTNNKYNFKIKFLSDLFIRLIIQQVNKGIFIYMCIRERNVFIISGIGIGFFKNEVVLYID